MNYTLYVFIMCVAYAALVNLIPCEQSAWSARSRDVINRVKSSFILLYVLIFILHICLSYLFLFIHIYCDISLFELCCVLLFF